MISWILLFAIFYFSSKVVVGYYKVPLNDLEKRGYDPDKLEDVVEYYEQKESGYFDL